MSHRNRSSSQGSIEHTTRCLVRHSIALVVLAFILLPHSATAALASIDATSNLLSVSLDLSGSSWQIPLEQADTQQSEQISLPIVSGEPPLDGSVGMPTYGILRIDKGMNSRNLPTTSGSIATPRSAGTFIEISEGEEQLPDSSGGANIWTGGHVIYENGAVIPAADREHVYVAQIGNTSTVTDPDSLPVEVKDLYRTPAELPQPESKIDTTDFAQRFQSAGDSYGMRDQVALVWSTDGQTNGVGVEQSALYAWQQAVAIAAIAHSAITESIPVTVGRPVEIAASFPNLAEGDPYVVYVDPVENGYDVVSRIDLKERYGDDIYAITRFQSSSEGLRVVATGFASSEGLVAAKGDQAHNIARISVLDGPGALELAKAIDNLSQASVFLPGIVEHGEFAPKLYSEQGKGFVYQRVRNDVPVYQVQEILVESPEPVRTWYYFSPSESPVSAMGEWLPAVEPDTIVPLIEEYKDVMNVEDDVEVHYRTYHTRNGPVLVATALYDSGDPTSPLNGDIPLMIAVKKKGDWEWLEAVRSEVATAAGFEASATISGWRALTDSTWQKTMKQDANSFQLDDLVMRRVIEPSEGQYSVELQKSLSQARTARQQGKKFHIGSGLVAGIRDFNPEWLWDGDFTQAELIDHATRYIHDVLQDVPDVDTVAVANETLPHLLGMQNLWTERNGIDRTVLLQSIYRYARQIAPDAKLALRDFSVEFAGYPRSDEFYQLIRSLNETEQQEAGSNLIDVAEFQLPLFLDPLLRVDPAMRVANFVTPEARKKMMNALQTNIQRYREIGVEVAITELLIPLDNLPGSRDEKLKLQAEIYHDIYSVCAALGVRVGVHRMYNDKRIEYPPGAADPYPRDENGKKTPAYFAINKAILGGQSQ